MLRCSATGNLAQKISGGGLAAICWRRWTPPAPRVESPSSARF